MATDPARAYREKAEGGYDGSCDRCDTPVDWADIQVHHVDRDHSNDNADNLEALCHECHRAEHHDDPMWGMVCGFPPPVVELIDEAVERHGYRSRSEAVARAVVNRYSRGFDAASESVTCWYTDDRHTKWVSDAVIEPSEDGPNGES